jgi:hypothetical protein
VHFWWFTKIYGIVNLQDMYLYMDVALYGAELPCKTSTINKLLELKHQSCVEKCHCNNQLK